MFREGEVSRQQVGGLGRYVSQKKKKKREERKKRKRKEKRKRKTHQIVNSI